MTDERVIGLQGRADPPSDLPCQSELCAIYVLAAPQGKTISRIDPHIAGNSNRKSPFEPAMGSRDYLITYSLSQ